MKTRRIDYSQGSIPNEEVRIKSEELGLDRVVYAKISSLTDNKTLLTPLENNTNFNRWLLDMNALNDTGVASEALLEFDRYLGGLGIEHEYPYIDDTYNVELWFDTAEQIHLRNVVHQNHTRVDNVIYSDGIDTYNVVHRTENS